MKLIQIKPEAVDVTWPYVKDLLEKPVKRNSGEFNLEDVKSWLLMGHMLLWVVANEKDGIVLAATTEIISYPRQKRLRVTLVGAKTGTMNKWLDYCWHKDSTLSQYAKENKVEKFEIQGREGWIRALFRHGFRKYLTILTKDVI